MSKEKLQDNFDGTEEISNANSLHGVSMPSSISPLDLLVLTRPRNLSLREIILGMGDVEVERLRPKVKEFVEKCKAMDGRFTWNLLKDAKDWKQVFELNSDWKGRSRKEMIKDVEGGARAFYVAFIKWAKKEAGNNKAKYESIVSEIFPTNIKKWAHLITLKQWQEEFSKHREWQGRSSIEMERDRKSGAKAFYVALTKWVRNEAAGDLSKSKNILSKFFSSKLNNWEHFITLEQWQKEFSKHEDWYGKTRSDMLKDKESGASTFYSSFCRWAKKEAGNDQGEYESLKSKLIYKVRNSWIHLTTLDQWIKEFSEHQDWQGKGRGEMSKDLKGGGGAFYQAFSSWAKEIALGNSNTYESLVSKLFQKKNK